MQAFALTIVLRCLLAALKKTQGSLKESKQS